MLLTTLATPYGLGCPPRGRLLRKTHPLFRTNFVASEGIKGKTGPPARFAYYRFNEKTPNDNDELIVGGTFAAWTSDNPNGWTPTGEVLGNGYGTGDPEISQVATGESHANAGGETGGMCNLYTSNGATIHISQNVTVIIGRRYLASIKVDKVTAGGIKIGEFGDPDWTRQIITSAGTYTWTFVAARTPAVLQIMRNLIELTDVTFDNVSIKLCAVEDSSGNDHDGLLQEDTHDAHVAGKINGAFDFDGSSDSMVVAAHSDIDIYGKTAYGISAWIYPHSDGGGNGGRVADKISGTTGYIFNISNEVGSVCHLVGYLYTSGALLHVVKNGCITLNQWNHVVFTYNEDGANHGKLYVNGVLQSLNTDVVGSGSPKDDSAADLYVGNRADGARGFDGLIDNMNFFSALSGYRVTRNYQSRFQMFRHRRRRQGVAAHC